MKKWSEVLTSPEYQALDEQNRWEAKNQYFNEAVTPKAIKTYGSEKLPAIRNSFFNTNYGELDPVDVTPKQPITEPPFSMFKETMKNLSSAIGETLLQAPIKTLIKGIKMQNEAIEAGKMGAIKEAYDTISGLVEFSRKQWKPTRKRWEEMKIDGVAIKDAPVFTPNIDKFLSGLSQKAKQKFIQSDYVKEKQRIMKAHPISTKVGGVVSDIGLLVAINLITKGKGSSPLLLRLGTKYPKIALTLQSMARSGKVLGISGFVKELSRTKDLPKAVKTGIKRGSYGALVFGPGGGIENPIVRGLVTTLSAHAISKISLLREKHQKGEKMSWQDWATPELETIFIAALCAITAPAHQRAIKAQKLGYAGKGFQEIERKGYKLPKTTLTAAQQREYITGTPLSKVYQFWAKAKGIPFTKNIQPKYAQDFNAWSNQQAKYPEVSKELITVKPEQSYQVTPVDKNIVTMTGKVISDEVSRGTVFEAITEVDEAAIKSTVEALTTKQAKEYINIDDSGKPLGKYDITFKSSSGKLGQEETQTGFENVRQDTLDEIINLEQQSKLPVVITGLTEKGHIIDKISHETGYKFDMGFRSNPELTEWIKSNFTKVDKRKLDGAIGYKNPQTDVIYYAEKENHWDVEVIKPTEEITTEEIKGAEGPIGEGKDVAIDYEQQKDIWIGEKDVRIFKTKTEKSRLQTELRTALGEEKYTEEAKDYDRAIQLYIDTQRDPESIAKNYDKLSAEQKKLVNISQNLPDNIKSIADKISDSYKEIGLEAQEADIIKNVLDNYVNRTWDLSEKQRTELFRKFGTTTRHAKSRVFATILDGWAQDYKLKVEGATNSLQILKEEMVKTIEDKKFIKALQKIRTIDGEPLLSTKSLEGYTNIEHSNFKIWRWAGEAKEGKTYGRNFFIDDEGNLFERRELYAPKEQARNLNNILGISKLRDIPGIKTITKYNAIVKAWILQSSFFHHLAFMRSYWFGTNHKQFGEMSPRQAYRQGITAIEEESPIVLLGVKNGLTLGLKQDWNEELLQEKTVIGEMLDKMKATREVKDKILELRKTQADFLFGKFGAGLKAKAFIIEYKNLSKKHPDKSADEVAKMVANLINDDFGGLHLQRLGRNPTVQHIFRLFALAPDWTESNVRSMVKAIKSGNKAETAFYRKFWAGILTKGAIITVLANLLLNPDEPWEVYKRAWKAGHLRWLDVDITNLYKALGGKSKNRKYFSVYGHFKDPLKFITHPIRSAQHKGSIVYRFFHEALSGVNWAGKRFTTMGEIAGIDKKGKIKGKTVTWDFKGRGPISYEQIPSFILAQLKAWQPIQIQNLLSWLAGEMEGFDALLKSAGLRVSTTYEKTGKRGRKVTRRRRTTR